ncbi:cytochrome P450 [Streptomyces tubbatahanensis]|uniref:Cytochrome P450 n=1 Tax=Streptomyces tubbatahanensis TaxID=2923272 RepID=A0ABY3XXL4_9ACTN|nr:cytochrome P450 [Streptomyces tubbatahanensis]UNS99095.1 cytochrome P450 [Streptomyces tubbatahanensis]
MTGSCPYSGEGRSAPAYPFRTAVGLEPDEEFTELRADEPVFRVTLPFGGEAWLVTRHADVRTVLADPRFSRTAACDPDGARFEPVPPPPVGIFVSDPPEHSRLRRLVAQAFTARRTERLRPRVREHVRLLLERMSAESAPGGPADLVHHFALPLPVTVICELLGIREEDRGRFRTWCDALLSTTALTREEVGSSREALSRFLAGQVAQRREQPGDDLLTALVQARDEGDRLSERELVVFTGGLLVAGYETTAGQLANFTYALLRRPHLWQELREDPERVPAAVEELLRYVPSLVTGGFTRVARQDVELSGTVVREGETVVPVLGSANWDEEVFADPHALSLDRSFARCGQHLAFGYGPHRCVGAQLARVELQEGLRGLLDVLPGLSLEGPVEEKAWKTGMIVRGLRELWVRW